MAQAAKVGLSVFLKTGRAVKVKPSAWARFLLLLRPKRESDRSNSLTRNGVKPIAGCRRDKTPAAEVPEIARFMPRSPKTR